jgi:hypothetical protein
MAEWNSQKQGINLNASVHFKVTYLPRSRNILSFSLSIASGLLLLLKGIGGPTETFLWLLYFLDSIITDETMLSIVTVSLLALVIVSMMGGLSVLAGGFFIIKDHVFTGKLLISLGAGVGVLWLIFLLFALITSRDLSSIIAQYSATGWVGVLLAFLARLIAK